jgi:hypothetical protein
MDFCKKKSCFIDRNFDFYNEGKLRHGGEKSSMEA